MNLETVILLWGLLAILGLILSIKIADTIAHRSYGGILARIEADERKLRAEIARRGVKELSQTQSGQELLRLMQSDRTSISAQQFPNFDVQRTIISYTLPVPNLIIRVMLSGLGVFAAIGLATIQVNTDSIPPDEHGDAKSARTLDGESVRPTSEFTVQRTEVAQKRHTPIIIIASTAIHAVLEDAVREDKKIEIATPESQNNSNDLLD